MNCGHYVPSMPTEHPRVDVSRRAPAPPVVRGDTVVTHPPLPAPKPSLAVIGSEPARYATCPACAHRLAVLEEQMTRLAESFAVVPGLGVFELTRAEHAEFGRLLNERRRLRAAIAADRLRLSGEPTPDPTTDRTGAASQ